MMVKKAKCSYGVQESFHSAKEPYEVKVSRTVLKERYPVFKVSTLTRLDKIRMRNKFLILIVIYYYFFAILGGSLKNTEKKITPKVPASRNTYTNVSID